MLFCHITTRIEGRKYENLLSEKGGQGFPHVVAMDAEGEVTAELSDRTVAGMRKMVETGAAYARLRTKKDRTNAEEIQVLEAEIGLGKVDVDDAKKRIGGLKDVAPADRKRLDGLLVDLEIKGVLDEANGRQVNSREESNALRIELGARFAAMWKAGKEPTGEQYVQPFYILMLEHAVKEVEPALFEKALDVLKKKFADEPRAAGFLEMQQKRLDELKAKAAAGSGEKKADDDGKDGGEDDDGM